MVSDMKKYRLKKFYLHPITSYIILTLLVVLFSALFKLFDAQVSYKIVDLSTYSYNQVNVVIENLLSYTGLKYIISNATKNFISFAPLSTYLIAALGVCICESSGYLDAICKKITNRISNKFLTFLVIFISTLSSLINEVGFVILIPIAAILFKNKKRNPMAGVCAAFAGTAFGYGTTCFVGSQEVFLIPYTKAAARMLDATFHVSLTSNLYIMIIFSIVLSIIGTIIIEKILIKKLGRYREESKEENSIEVIDLDEEDIWVNCYKQKMQFLDEEDIEQKRLKDKIYEDKGFKLASIGSFIFILIFVYSLIPGLPLSGLLLDMNESTYLDQIFGANSYFQDGFSFMISLLLIISGLLYGFGSKKFTNDKEVINNTNDYLLQIGQMMLLLFVASQFIAIYKMTNFGNYIAGVLVNFLGGFEFGGLPFLIISILVVVLADIFFTNTQSKRIIFSTVMVPVLMQSNFAPQFVQFVYRGADSIANGISPLFAYFVIYIGYLNIYNTKKEKPVTMGEGIKYMLPYFAIIGLTWILLLVGYFIIGLPIGPGVYPVL